jgi:hypothetical protein
MVKDILGGVLLFVICLGCKVDDKLKADKIRFSGDSQPVEQVADGAPVVVTEGSPAPLPTPTPTPTPTGTAPGETPSSGTDSVTEDSGSASGVNSGIKVDSDTLTYCQKLQHMNTIFVFDNSSSQSRDDLGAMRLGVNSLVDKLSELKKRFPQMTMEAATVRFSRIASIGSNGWSVLDGLSVPAGLTSDIQEATRDDGGSTHYLAALQKVSELLALRPQLVDPAVIKRTQIVFMSDGEPDDRESEILAAVRAMIASHKVKLTTLAIGGDEIEVLEGMAVLSQEMGKAPFHFVSRSRDPVIVSQTFAQVAQSFEHICAP